LPTILVVFAGLPGSGKFVLARRLADATGATYLRIDTIESAAISTLMLPITLCDWSST
jgi:predicted kinase